LEAVAVDGGRERLPELGLCFCFISVNIETGGGGWVSILGLLDWI